MRKVDYYWMFVAKRLAKKVGITFFLIIVILVFCSSLCFGQIDFEVTIDEHEIPLPTEGGYYNLTGGDRGLMHIEDISYSRDDTSYTATVIRKNISDDWTWGGMWYSPIRVTNDNIPLNFSAIFGPYIQPAYQGQIIGAEIVVSNAHSPSNNSALELRLEFKDENGGVVYSSSWTDLIPGGTYPKTYTVSLNPPTIYNVKEIVWIMDHAQVGDSISIDRVRLKARVPEMLTEEQAFLWTYSWLMANYDPVTGIVQDRSNYGSGDMENITATAKAAKLTYYAYRKEYVTYDNAKTIITKIADTLINTIPRGPSGKNTLWPHFTQHGGTEALPPHDDYAGTEWASGDTAYAALDMIAVLQMLGDPQNQLSVFENFLRSINWVVLLIQQNGKTYISHGYDYDGNLIPYEWKGFGMETIGVIGAYASATGNVANMEAPPSDNGSGFIDNAHYPIVFSDLDRWENDWDTYRVTMADVQIGWYCTSEHYHQYLCNAGLFGLSAAEHTEDESYDPVYGVGGKADPYDGDGVITLHYSAMIADIRLEQAKHVWEVLRDRSVPFLQDSIIISPLNNMESMHVDKNTGEVTAKYLKGSWNLALQSEGWAYADPEIRNNVIMAIEGNIFLNSGYMLLRFNKTNTIRFYAEGQTWGIADLDHFWLSTVPDDSHIYFEQHCEDPDGSTVGFLIYRSNAINDRVWGQFGVTDGEVWYSDIPGEGTIYIKIRYSRSNHLLDNVPIQIFINNELQASFQPIDQGDWNAFTTTEWIPINFVNLTNNSYLLWTR